MKQILWLFRLLNLGGRALLIWLRIRPLLPHVRWLLAARPYILQYLQELRKLNALTRH
jgi:hypothetical protein